MMGSLSVSFSNRRLLRHIGVFLIEAASHVEVIVIVEGAESMSIRRAKFNVLNIGQIVFGVDDERVTSFVGLLRQDITRSCSWLMNKWSTRLDLRSHRVKRSVNFG